MDVNLTYDEEDLEIFKEVKVVHPKLVVNMIEEEGFTDGSTVMHEVAAVIETSKDIVKSLAFLERSIRAGFSLYKLNDANEIPMNRLTMITDDTFYLRCF